jgi:antitoxin (DNA-binding transcriptional repressor) of toxin-antitoxin stability system
MTTMTIPEAQAQLPQLIEQLRPGEEIVLTRDELPVARIVCEPSPTWQRPGPGLFRGKLTIVADDDEHLLDFTEYMP